MTDAPQSERRDISLDKKTFFDLLWNGVLQGKVSTADYTKETGKKVYSHGKRVYNTYTGERLRQLRHQRARAALDAHYKHDWPLDGRPVSKDHFLDGSLIEENRCIDLISA